MVFTEIRVTVLRDGEWVDNIDAGDLVPGEIIQIKVGGLRSYNLGKTTLCNCLYT